MKWSAEYRIRQEEEAEAAERGELSSEALRGMAEMKSKRRGMR